MANAVVTSSAKCVKVEFNDLAGSAGMVVGHFSREHLAEVHEMVGGYVKVVLDSGESWQVSTDGALNTLPVDSVDGVPPTDAGHLADMIAALIDY